MFRDREDAGRRLADRLALEGFPDPVVYALPRGGVPIARAVADRLGAPLDLVLVRKIGAPGEPELALGAVVDGAAPVYVENADIAAGMAPPEGWLAQAKAEAMEEIGRRRDLWLKGRAPISPRGRTALVVDDGIATGATALAAIRSLRARGAGRVVLAAPTASARALQRLRAEADAVVCLETPEPFQAVGQAYEDFAQLTDADVASALGRR